MGGGNQIYSGWFDDDKEYQDNLHGINGRDRQSNAEDSMGYISQMQSDGAKKVKGTKPKPARCKKKLPNALIKAAH